MRHLVVGMGQIGQSVHKLLLKTKDPIETYDPIKNPKDELSKISKRGAIDILHVAFPYNDKFIDYVKQYQKLYSPKATIVYSTVQIGTCKQLGDTSYHSPVVGRHPNLYEGMMHGLRWIGTNDKDAKLAANLWKSIGVKTKVVKSTDATEFLKIRSTSKFAINLVWTDYEKSIADDIGMDFELLKEFDRDYNHIYQKLGMDWAQQYILYPPNGKITKHCVVPNAEVLNEKYPNDMLQKIIAMKAEDPSQ